MLMNHFSTEIEVILKEGEKNKTWKPKFRCATRLSTSSKLKSSQLPRNDLQREKCGAKSLYWCWLERVKLLNLLTRGKHKSSAL